MSKSSVRDVRKHKLSPEQVKEVCLLWEKYITETEFPNTAGFISRTEIRHKFKLTRQYITDHPELFEYYVSSTREKAEAYLLDRGLRGIAMPMVIFSLKQGQYGGYSDQQQIDLKSSIQPIKFISSVPRPTDKKTRTAKSVKTTE